MWWHKKAFPTFWFGFIGIWSIFALSSVLQGDAPFFVLLIACGMAAVGYTFMRILIFPLADEVWIDDENLLVRKGGEEDSFPISTIINVESSKMQNPEHITLTLRQQTKFGTEVVFSPPTRWWPFGRHPVAQELLSRVHGLDELEPS